MLNSYFLKKKINLFFFQKINLFFISFFTGIICLNLPYYYFYKNNNNFKSFKFTNYYFYKSFLSFFSFYYLYFFKLYFFKLLFSGLGFRIKRISKQLYRFFFTLPNYIYLYIPLNIVVRHRRKRIIFISNNFSDLRILIVKLLLLKQFFPYNKPVFTFKKRIFLLKPGKKPF